MYEYHDCNVAYEGWLHLRCQVGSEDVGATAKAVELLHKSVDLDRESWETWYYLGRCLVVCQSAMTLCRSLCLCYRCFASKGESSYAFLCYRHSIERNESSADTWCSIG